MLQRPFFFSSRRRHTRCLSDWSSDVCSSDLHLKKVSRQGDKGGAAAYAIENRITEICARFGQTEAMREKRQAPSRSEERRVGKEGRTGWDPDHSKNNTTRTNSKTTDTH